MSVQEGDTAPDFSLPASSGRTVSLAGMKGRPFVLYFYPKADTPGCTKEACAFQEALPQLGKIGIEVIGVSPDKMKPIEKIRRQIQTELSARVGRNACGGGEVRDLGGKVHVWPQVHGDGTQHVPDRPERQGCQGVAQGQRHRARSGGDAGGRRADVGNLGREAGETIRNSRLAYNARRPCDRLSFEAGRPGADAGIRGNRQLPSGMAPAPPQFAREMPDRSPRDRLYRPCTAGRIPRAPRRSRQSTAARAAGPTPPPGRDRNTAVPRHVPASRTRTPARPLAGIICKTSRTIAVCSSLMSRTIVMPAAAAMYREGG